MYTPVYMVVVIMCKLSSKPWPDHAIKKEIDRLLVKCHNHEMGCGWKGLFKDLIVSYFTYCI